MPKPKTVKQIRQFLGISSYFRKFIRNYATITEPLTRLTRKDVKWTRGESQEKAVKQIKKALTFDPIYQYMTLN